MDKLKVAVAKALGYVREFGGWVHQEQRPDGLVNETRMIAEFDIDPADPTVYEKVIALAIEKDGAEYAYQLWLLCLTDNPNDHESSRTLYDLQFNRNSHLCVPANIFLLTATATPEQRLTAALRVLGTNEE